jgi:cold shock CspA family protein
MPELQVDLEVEGVVRRYSKRDAPNSSPGFGFVTPTNAAIKEEIFVDSKCVKKSGLESLSEGTRVKCLCVRRERGLKAKRIRILT